MLSIVLFSSLLAVSPPALPEEPAVEGAVEGPAEAPTEVVDGVDEADGPDAIVIVAAPAALPVTEAVEPPQPFVLVERRMLAIPPPTRPRLVVPPPPPSGTGRFVGGSVMLLAGLGLLTVATLEFADTRDTTQPYVSQVPAGISMLVIGGLMIGTGARDQRRLGEWEAATGVHARPSGNGLIVGGVTVAMLGGMSAIATAIASDMGLDAPLSIPAGWATAGVGLGAGTALLIGGIVRRVRYGNWRASLRGMPIVAPSRAGASVGFVGQF